WIREAEEAQIHTDFQAYVHQIAALHPPWPFLDHGQVSEVAIAVLANASHQHGNLQFVQGLIGQHPASEGALLTTIAEAIVAMVQPQYVNGVRNRYAQIRARYGDSPR